MLIAIFLAIGIGGCREDSPLPTPPPSPLPPISLSTSEVWLMVGMEAEVMISNSKEFSVSAEKSGMITTRIEGSKIFMGALTPGEVSLIIIDKKDSSRRAVLKITISPIKFGVMDTQGRMILEANYRYQTPSTLHLAPSGALRKKEFFKLPHKGSWKIGESVAITYKKAADAAPTTLQTSIVAQSATLVYLKTSDGKKYIIFPKTKDGE